MSHPASVPDPAPGASVSTTLSLKNNLYALPSGEIVNLPAHCCDATERFTLRDRSLVWAVRVGEGTPEAAARLAASLSKPQRGGA